MMNNFKKLLSVLFLCSAFSCAGGGTIGTGGRDYSGRVRIDGAPGAGIEVQIQETGQKTTTDSNGDFKIETESHEPEVTLHFTSAEVESSLTVSDIPVTASEVQLEVTVDPESNVAQADSVNFVERAPDIDSGADSPPLDTEGSVTDGSATDDPDSMLPTDPGEVPPTDTDSSSTTTTTIEDGTIPPDLVFPETTTTTTTAPEEESTTTTSVPVSPERIRR